MSRDSRWENVFASVGPPEMETWNYPEEVREDFMVFFIEVVGQNGKVLSHRIYLTKKMMESLHIYKFTLDKMVDQLSEAMADG